MVRSGFQPWAASPGRNPGRCPGLTLGRAFGPPIPAGRSARSNAPRSVADPVKAAAEGVVVVAGEKAQGCRAGGSAAAGLCHSRAPADAESLRDGH